MNDALGSHDFNEGVRALRDKRNPAFSSELTRRDLDKSTVNIAKTGEGMAQFDGKVALVTGSGAGIGAVCAAAFAGRAPGGGDRSQHRRRRSTSPRSGLMVVGPSSSRRCDRSRCGRRDCGFAVSTFGGLHYAHNNAGVLGESARLTDCDDQIWFRTVQINLNAVYLGLKHQIPAILASGGGAVVNTSSFSGLVAVPSRPPMSPPNTASSG